MELAQALHEAARLDSSQAGSTLVEQMLGGHPEIASGGELEFLLWLIRRNLGPYPQRVTEVSATDTVTWPFSCVNFTAFDRRLLSTCRMRVTSASIQPVRIPSPGGRSGIFASVDCPRPAGSSSAGGSGSSTIRSGRFACGRRCCGGRTACFT